MIFLLDADQNGIDSIQKRIEAKKVQLIPSGSFVAYNEACKRLAERKPNPGDRVVLDSFTYMLSTTRGDFKHGSDPTGDVWADRDKYFGDKQALNAYQASTNMTMRWLKNLRNVGYNLTVCCHEDEALDETTMTTKRNVKANPEARDMLLASASDVFRLTEATTDKIVVDPETGEQRVVYPRGERILLLRRTQDSLAKYHVDIDLAPKLPDGIIAPTMEKIQTVLGKVPTFLVLYGLPGVGKTTLATS